MTNVEHPSVPSGGYGITLDALTPGFQHWDPGVIAHAQTQREGSRGLSPPALVLHFTKTTHRYSQYLMQNPMHDNKSITDAVKVLREVGAARLISSKVRVLFPSSSNAYLR